MTLESAGVVLVLLAAAPADGQTSWPTVRHDNQRTGRSPIVASQTDETLYPVVSICCTSASPHPPVVGVEGTVHFTVAGTLRTIDPSTGVVLWSVPDAGHAPTVGPDGAIYVHSGLSGDTTTPGFVRAFNPDGTLRWSFVPPEPGAGFSPPMTVDDDGTVYGTYSAILQQVPIIHGGFRFALDANGAVIWNVGGPDEGISLMPPVIAQGGALFEIGSSLGDTHGKLRRIDPTNGAVMWSAPSESNMPIVGAPMIAGDGLVVASVRDVGGFPYASRLVAFDQATGAETWSVSYFDAFGINSLSGYFDSPVVLSTGEIISCWDEVYRISPQGQLVATVPFPAAFGAKSTPVAGGDDTLYMWTQGADGFGSLVAFSPFTGSVKFLFFPPSGGCRSGAQPAIAPDGTLFATWHRRTVCEDFSGTVKYVSFVPPESPPCFCAGNLPPTALAVGDAVVPPGTLVTLDGNNSADPEQGDLLYEWREVISGSPGPIVSLDPVYARTTNNTNVVFTQTFQLKVTDCCDLVDVVTVTQTTLPVGTVVSPIEGDLWAIGTQQSIEWLPGTAPTARVIQVARDGGPWKTITISTPNDGQYAWTVTGPATVNAVIRNFPGGNPGAAQESGAFSIVAPGDVDGDGMVGILDFLAVLGAWGPCAAPCPPQCAADFDNDCQVGITDMLIVLANWD